MLRKISTGSIHRILFVSVLPVLLALMMTVGYPGSTPVIQAAGTPGALVPLGDQLGDVGQYYSQISPNLNTNAYIYNTSGTSEEVEFKIYDDTGVNVRTATCTVAANRVLRAQFDYYQGEGLYLTGGTGCTYTGSTTKFHGLYHMKITQTSAGEDLAVAVNNWTNTDARGSSDAYQAVPDWAVGSEYVLPAVVVYRNYGWDTEIVVQNVSGSANTVTFSWAEDGGAAVYSNNTATLASNERRVFLASQLMYANSNGSLVEKDGWAWMKVSGTGSIAVTSNVFKQGLTNGQYRAELGSERMMSFEAPVAGTELFVPGFVVDGTNSYFRIANASGATANITARLYDSSGSQVGNTYSPTINTQRAGVYSSSVFGASNGTYTLRIESNYNVTAAAWHETTGGHTGVTAQRVGDTDGANLFLPFYWSDYLGWDDNFLFTKTSGGLHSPLATAYKQADGSYHEAFYWFDLAQYAGAAYGFSANTDVEMYAKQVGSHPLGVGQFEYSSTANDWLMSYNGIAKTDNLWYVPFAPAPVVPFEWDATEDATYPSVRFGWAGNPEDRSGTVPVWAKDLNWYDWGKDRARCEKYTRYIPMDWGLGGGVSVTYNTEARLKAIKNTVPSACAGRPLLLANEPNATDQSNMTHHEMARQIFVYRAWIGDLHSQAYAKEDSGYDIGTTHGIASESAGKTTPTYTDYNSFKTYWSNNMSNVFGSLPYDSLAVHFYLFKDSNGVETSGMATARQNEIAEWKTEATSGGYKIEVTEYGIFPVGDSGHSLYCNTTCINDRISKLHDGILSNLSGSYRQLLWYSFDNADCRAPYYCSPPDPLDWRWTNAMESINSTWQPTVPVGQTWVDDTKSR